MYFKTSPAILLFFHNIYNKMKKCTKCKQDKVFTEFCKNKNKKDGLHIVCKSCIQNISKTYYAKNKEKINDYAKQYYINNKEEHINRTSTYIDSHPEVQKKYRDKTKEKTKIYQKKYIQNNRNKRNEYAKNYSKKRRIEDPLFNLTNFLRVRTYLAFKAKKWKKEGSTEKFLGGTFDIVKNHIESQFIEGMSWTNHGEWHVDHIIPLSSAKNKEELIKLCHYTNLQPLWALDNYLKSNKI